MAITRAQQARQMYKKGSKEPVKQAGVMNYMPSEMVTVPKIAKSSPDTPTAKLAYITPEEQDILIDLNLYGSLDGKPNRGPGGIPSLEGDFGSPTGQGYSDNAGSYSGGGGGSRSDNDVSGRKDTGTGNYQVDDQKAQDEYDKNRKKREAEEKKKRDKEAEKKRRKEVKEFTRNQKKRDAERRKAKLNAILSGKSSYTTQKYDAFGNPIEGEEETFSLGTNNKFGINDKEYKDLEVQGLTPEKVMELDKKGIDSSDPLYNLLEKNDRFSGVNLEAFQNEFNLPKTGLTSLDIALGFAEPLLRKGSKKTKEFFSGDVLNAGKYKIDGTPINSTQFAMLDPALMDDVYKDYMGKRMSGETDAYGNPNPNFGRDDDGPDPILPILPINQDPTTPTPTRNLGGLAPRFAGSIFDFTGLADGGRVAAMGGGLMNTDIMGGAADGNIDEAGRQMYFLGKLVKKATRAVKKVVKSPFGKAALGAALTFGIPGTSFGGLSSVLKNKGIMGSLFGQAGSRVNEAFVPYKEGFFTKLGLTKGGGSLMPTLKGGLALGLGVPFALDLLGVGKDDDDKMDLDDYYRKNSINIADIRMNPYNYLAPRFAGSRFAADGGLMRMGYQEGGDAEPVAKKTMPLIDMDGQEKDYRETGGFVDMGRMERADDVPARLSKNEFVFTADAVRNAGEGDIDKGAEVMYNMMKNLESGGDVSEESQGLDGAREMFQTSQRLEEVL